MSSLHLDIYEGFDRYVSLETGIYGGSTQPGGANVLSRETRTPAQRKAQYDKAVRSTKASSSTGGVGSGGSSHTTFKAPSTAPKSGSTAGSTPFFTGAPKAGAPAPARTGIPSYPVSRFAGSKNPMIQKAVATVAAELGKAAPKSWTNNNPYYDDAVEKEMRDDASQLARLTTLSKTKGGVYSQHLGQYLAHLRNKYTTGNDDLPGTLNVYGDAAVNALNTGELNPTLSNIPNSAPRFFEGQGGWSQGLTFVQHAGGGLGPIGSGGDLTGRWADTLSSSIKDKPSDCNADCLQAMIETERSKRPSGGFNPEQRKGLELQSQMARILGSNNW